MTQDRTWARTLGVALVLASLTGFGPARSASADTVIGADGFGRTVTGGLGTADAGGAWSLGGTSSSFSVGSGVAALGVTRGKTLSGYFTAGPAQDTDVTTTVRFGALPVGGPVYAGVVGRRVGTHDYASYAVVSPTGALQLSLQRDGLLIGSSPVIASSVAAGTTVHLRMQTVGSGPTTLRARAWLDGAVEPTTWPVSKTDATAANQGTGGVGIRAYLSSSATNDPIVYRFDDFAAAALSSTPPPNQAPTASFTVTNTGLTATADAGSSTDPDGTIASYAWTFGDGGAGTGVQAVHTYAAAGTYPVTLTVRDDRGATAVTTRPVTVTAARPTQSQWLADVATALNGANAYLDSQAGVSRPAIVLDIDNTSLQSYYQTGAATPPVLSFAQRAVADGYAVLFATGRSADSGGTLRQLQNAGYRVDALCFRDPAVPTVTSKTNCRAAWAASGYTIVANAGNHTSDLDGGNSGRQYLLPNYGFLD
jgi:PKD repeat protein